MLAPSMPQRIKDEVRYVPGVPRKMPHVMWGFFLGYILRDLSERQRFSVKENIVVVRSIFEDARRNSFRARRKE